MLAQFALLAFAIAGVAALAIDMGFVFLTHTEMQQAADTAALQGLRERDALADPTASDAARRGAARDIVRWTFDDDFDLSADALQLGAGPKVTLSAAFPGEPELADLQMLTLDSPPVYKPVLQTNVTNEQHGDMVSGTFDPAVTAATESSDYARNDFTPAADAAASAAAGAFLVRLRRTNRPNVIFDEVDDVSSHGPGLPFVFGRATTIGKDPDADYSPREHGLTVRATAIANARAALRVGGLPGPSDATVLRVAPFVLERSFWEEADLIVPVHVAADGTIRKNSDSSVAGRYTAEPPTIVGQQAGAAAAPAAGVIPPAGYAPIFVPSGAVIGFGRVDLEYTGGALSQITKIKQQVAPVNATAHLAGLTVAETSAALTALAANPPLAGALLVPVLVR